MVVPLEWWLPIKVNIFGWLLMVLFGQRSKCSTPLHPLFYSHLIGIQKQKSQVILKDLNEDIESKACLKARGIHPTILRLSHISF